jgi:hypothetical protein
MNEYGLYKRIRLMESESPTEIFGANSFRSLQFFIFIHHFITS